MPDAAPLSPPEPSVDPSEPSLPPPSPSIQLTPLLGQARSEQDQILNTLYASQIATLVWAAEAAGGLEQSRRGVIVGIALQRSPNNAQGVLGVQERRVFLAVMKIVQDLLKQT